MNRRIGIFCFNILFYAVGCTGKMKTDKALKKSKEAGRMSLEAIILREYAKKHATLGDGEKAAQSYEQSLALWKLIPNSPAKALT